MPDCIIDTGPIVAFFDSSDKYSNPFRDYLKTFSGKLYTTLSVVTEASYLLEDIKPAQLDFIEWIIEGAIEIADINGSDFELIHKYMTKYRDMPMDFADATLVILANKLKINRIITLDTDFDVYKTIGGKNFNNLIHHLINHKR